MSKIAHLSAKNGRAGGIHLPFSVRLPLVPICMALYLGVPATAYAQASAAASPQPESDSPPAGASQGETPELVVTGSRVLTNGFNSPTPLTVLGGAELLRQAPTNIADAVNKLPLISGSATTQNTSNSVSDGNAGISNLNLRALGPGRTLVLLDGMRIVPSSISGFYNNGGAVDINPFPDALIKRVDIVTGGASAVYGSDAISGVVNFVLDKTFTGLKGEAQGGVDTYGEDATYRMTLTGGTSFADGRGHFLVSGAYTHNNGISSGFGRAWLMNNLYVPINNPAYTPTNGQPAIIVAKGGSAQYTPGGIITSGPLRGIDFGPGGTTRLFNYGTPSDGTYMAGGDSFETAAATSQYLRPSVSLNPRLTRYNIFTRASFDITDNIQVYGQFTYAKTDTFTSGGSQTLSNFVIRSGNPFIPASVQDRMNALGLSSITMSEDVSSSIGYVQVYDTRWFYQYAGGLEGKVNLFGSDWSWNAFGNYTRSRSLISVPNDLVRPYFALAINAVRDPATGVPVCASTLAGAANGCVPFNPFGGVNSQAAVNYVTDLAYLDQTLEQSEESATLSGSPFSTWAGPVNMAFSFEHRDQSVTGQTNELDLANAFYVGNYHDTHGKVGVTEGAIEVLVPLAKDAFLAKDLSLNGAFRKTHYTTSGGVSTWKIGLTYRPISDVLIRATRSRDIRAPNLGELFSAGSSGTGLINDPFKGGARVPFINVRIGNPNLTPEIATATGAGIVYSPSWLPGFSASFDYFNVEVARSINTSSQQAIMDSCYAGSALFCSFIERDSAGNLTFLYSRPANTSFIRTNGFDVEASYRKPVSDIFGKLSGDVYVRGLATHSFHLTQVASNGQVIEGANVTNGYTLITPSWKYSATMGYDSGSFSTAFTVRGYTAGVQSNSYFECTSGCPASSPTRTTINNNRAPGQMYMDLNLTYHLKAWSSVNADIFLNATNLNNETPKDIPRINFIPGNYDVLGRVFRAGFRFKM